MGEGQPHLGEGAPYLGQDFPQMGELPPQTGASPPEIGRSRPTSIATNTPALGGGQRPGRAPGRDQQPRKKLTRT